MFTDTLQHPSLNLNTEFPNLAGGATAPALSLNNSQENTFNLYQRYRDVALALIDSNSPQLFYRVYENEPNSYNGEAMHEKFIYQGQSVLDVSVGKLDYPWFAADANQVNEITSQHLHDMAATELDPLIKARLLILSNFAASLLPPPFTRYYHYLGMDGTRALTVVDEFNSVKLNIILTYTEEVFPVTMLSGSF